MPSVQQVDMLGSLQGPVFGALMDEPAVKRAVSFLMARTSAGRALPAQIIEDAQKVV
jgi:hypothetical protein